MEFGRIILGVVIAFMMTGMAKSEPVDDGPRHFGEGPSRCPARSVEMNGFLFDDETTITFLGTIPARRFEYWIYYHDHVYRHNYRETRHIILMGRNCRFLGAYHVTADPIGVRGNEILFDVSSRFGNTIRFINRIPPATIWIDGEVHNFVRNRN